MQTSKEEKVCIAKPEGLRKLVQTSKGERRFALRSFERRFVNELRSNEKVSANFEKKVCIAELRSNEKVRANLERREGLYCEAEKRTKPLPYTTNFISLKANALTQPSFFVSN